MAVAPYRSGQRLGWFPPAPSSTSTSQINAAAAWYAVSFVADSARTLSAVRVFVSAVSGTLGASDITADLYDSAGASAAPGASIEAGKVPSATIASTGIWYDFTGFTTALTANLTYWLVFKNVNGVPASNNCTFRVISSILDVLTGASLSRDSWGTATSANSGSTWSVNGTRSGVRIAYADGSYDGIPVSNTAAAAVGDGIYSTRESGVKFTSPASSVLKVNGLAIFTGTKTGAPTGNLRLGLWTGTTPTLVAYTNTIPTSGLTFGAYLYAYFASTQTIAPGTVCRLTLGETTQSDASTNRFNMQEVTWDTDSNSTILLPWNGACQKTYFDGSNWTDTAGSIFAHAVILDTAGEFGSGPLPHSIIVRGQQSY